MGIETHGVVALTIGAPGGRQLKEAQEIVLKAAHPNNLLGDCSAGTGSFLQYGPRSGSPRFRKHLANFLSQSYGDTVDRCVHSNAISTSLGRIQPCCNYYTKSFAHIYLCLEKLFVTSGATSGLFLVASLMFSSHATVFVEDPTYFIAIGLLRDDIGLNIVPVPTDTSGIDTDILAALLEQQNSTMEKNTVSEGHPFSAMVYLVSTYNNPRGTCLSSERSLQLVGLARKYNLLVFSDDVYNLLHYDETSPHAPPRLLTYDKQDDIDYRGHVISNGTFSKILAPGIRLGWIESGDRIINLLKKSSTAMSSGCFNQFTAEVLTTSLALGLQQHLQSLKTEYSKRVKSVAVELRNNLPESVTFDVPQGGYFFWLQMPDGALADKVAEDVWVAYKIRILPGNRCSPTGQCQNCVRISFSHYEEDVLLDAVRKLSDVITKHVTVIPLTQEKTD
ncbi:Aminotran_1_2 domain-containing protein [Lamellibrachia satsuma]|nr:Aminotran_1_2 domain-containing protein [Lamellibrachia satsuma]